MKCVGISQIGLVRKRNEDRFYTDDTLCIIADGMGGHQGGEIASTIAIDTIKDVLSQGTGVTEEHLISAVKAANSAILDYGASNSDMAGMGTTTVLAVKEGNTLFWANVGDSRLYLYDGGELKRITTDHSLVQTWVDTGALEAKEVQGHPQRNILTRAVGIDQVLTVDTGTVPITAGVRLLLCSDGLSGYVNDEIIENYMRRYDDDKALLDALVQAVYDCGAKDNVSIIVGTV